MYRIHGQQQVAVFPIDLGPAPYLPFCFKVPDSIYGRQKFNTLIEIPGVKGNICSRGLFLIFLQKLIEQEFRIQERPNRNQAEQ